MSDENSHKVIFITGVSGTGKSTIGNLLSVKLGIPFFDGDAFHSKENIKKMTNGIPLNDEDRSSWLQEINWFAKKELVNTSCIIACSALKHKYRNELSLDIVKNIEWVHLFGSYPLIYNRMKSRGEHFMPTHLLKSQFDILEKPSNAINIKIDKSPEEIVNIIMKEI